MFLPFLAAILFKANFDQLSPPSDAKKQVLHGVGYALRLDGQPKDLGLLWYDAQGTDRHHAVEVCLQYRGIELENSEVADVKTDGDHWYCEFFIVKDKLIEDHSSYVWETFGFRQDPGVHLIMIAKNDSFSAEDFAEMSKLYADKLYESLKQDG